MSAVSHRYCALSPSAEITLDEPKVRRCYSIHETATHFAFVYPVAELEDIFFSELETFAHELDLHRSVLYLLVIGGFVYLNQRDGAFSVMQVNSLSMSPSRTSMYFEGPIDLPESAFESLARSGRMAAVTRVMRFAFDAVGEYQVAWVNPGEHPCELSSGEQLKEMSPSAEMEHGVLQRKPWPKTKDHLDHEIYKDVQHPWADGAFIFSDSDGTCTMYRLLARIRNADKDFEHFSQFERVARASTKTLQTVEETLVVIGEETLTSLVVLLQNRWRYKLERRRSNKTASPAFHPALRRQGMGRLSTAMLQMDPSSSRPPGPEARRATDRIPMGRQARRQQLDQIVSVADRSLTPIMWAARDGLSDAVQNLLDAGATPSPSAILLALQSGNRAAASALIGHRRCTWMSEFDESFNHKSLGEEGRLLLFDILAEFASEDSLFMPRQVVSTEIAKGLELALLKCMRVMEEVNKVIHDNVEKDPARADEHRVVSWQMQICAAALLSLKPPAMAYEMMCEGGSDANTALNIALREEAKVFLSQRVVCKFVDHVWWGRFSLTWSCVSHLMLQLPLLVPFAVWPDLKLLDQVTTRDLLFAPAVSFCISLLTDIAFAMQMTFASRDTFSSDVYLLLLLAWAGASLLAELKQLTLAALPLLAELKQLDSSLSSFSVSQLWQAYSKDRFNKVREPCALSAQNVCSSYIS